MTYIKVMSCIFKLLLRSHNLYNLAISLQSLYTSFVVLMKFKNGESFLKEVNSDTRLFNYILLHIKNVN